VLKKISRKDIEYKLYARPPVEITKDLAAGIYGEQGEEYL
jgi:hypothetical protein